MCCCFSSGQWVEPQEGRKRPFLMARTSNGREGEMERSVLRLGAFPARTLLEGGRAFIGLGAP